jgi:hypothetical protein
MNAKQFVRGWKKEKDELVRGFTNPRSGSLVSQKVAALKLSPKQRAAFAEIVDDMLTDAFYTLLMGLDGEASIGGRQVTYKIHDDKGKLISDCGEIEAEAYEQFHAKGR